MTKEMQKKEDARPTDGVAVLFEWVELFVYAFVIVLLVTTFVVRHSPVIGTSMCNTLQEKDVLMVWELGYTPRQGDIVVAQTSQLGYDQPIVKRVIAHGGQTVDIDFTHWKVYVYDGTVEQYQALSEEEKAACALTEDYILYREGVGMHRSDVEFPLQVPEGRVFLMGDNRNGSMDSRNSVIGCVDERNVLGKVVFRFFPLSTFGIL